jgi:hypothetical protein
MRRSLIVLSLGVAACSPSSDVTAPSSAMPAALSPTAAKAPATPATPATPMPSVAITGLGFKSELRPGTPIQVVANASVVRVEYSIGARGYMGMTESYLGRSTTAPFTFTWNGFSSAIDLGRNLELVVRAFDRTDRVATVTLPILMPGSCGYSPRQLSAQNCAASGYWDVTNIGGASLVGIAYNSAVRAATQLDKVGEAADFPVTANVAGRYEISVNQLRLSRAKPAFSVRVNGTVAEASLSAVQTATAWNNFGAADFSRSASTTLVANLEKGKNVIRVQSLGAGVLTIGSVSIAQPPASK